MVLSILWYVDICINISETYDFQCMYTDICYLFHHKHENCLNTSHHQLWYWFFSIVSDPQYVGQYWCYYLFLISMTLACWTFFVYEPDTILSSPSSSGLFSVFSFFSILSSPPPLLSTTPPYGSLLSLPKSEASFGKFPGVEPLSKTASKGSTPIWFRHPMFTFFVLQTPNPMTIYFYIALSLGHFGGTFPYDQPQVGCP